MAASTARQSAREVLDQFDRTLAEEAGVIVRNTPAPLFKLLVFALLASARISSNIAAAAARALFDEGWTTPQKLADTTWERRTKVLNESGYARYDESTSRMLADSTGLLLDRWRGDLRRLRDEADRNPDEERKLLQEFKGIGRVGADIFVREAQVIWPECYPSVDDRALQTARKLGLGDDPESVAKLVPRHELPRLVDGLVRLSRK